MYYNNTILFYDRYPNADMNSGRLSLIGAQICAASYHDDHALWKESCATFMEDSMTSTQWYFYERDEILYLVFRGTSDILDWMYNVCYKPITNGVHFGFHHSFTRIKNMIYEFILKRAPRISHLIVTGHSLGAALAYLTVCHLEDAMNHSLHIETIRHKVCLLYGCPRFVTESFKRRYPLVRWTLTSFICNGDLVPSFKYDTDLVLPCSTHVLLTNKGKGRTITSEEYPSTWLTRWKSSLIRCTCCLFIWDGIVQKHSPIQYIKRIEMHHKFASTAHSHTHPGNAR